MNRRKLLSFGPLALLGSLIGVERAKASPQVVVYASSDTVKYTGADGTLFMCEPLARTNDSYDYLLKAYPPGFRDGVACIFQRLEFSALRLVNDHPELFARQELNRFIHQYYSHEFDHLKATPSRYFTKMSEKVLDPVKV